MEFFSFNMNELHIAVFSISSKGRVEGGGSNREKEREREEEYIQEF